MWSSVILDALASPEEPPQVIFQHTGKEKNPQFSTQKLLGFYFLFC